MTESRPVPGFLLAITALLAGALWQALAPGPAAQAVLQSLATLTLVVALGTPGARLPPGLAAGVLVLALLPWLYLIPLPATWLSDHGARLHYATPSQLLGLAGPAWTPVSLAPFATVSLALDLLPPLAAFVAFLRLEPRHRPRVLWLLLALAVAQGLFGLLQYASASSGSHWLPVQGAHAGSATGSFTNRNHLALLLAMLFPLTVLLTLQRAAWWARGGGGEWRPAPGGRYPALGYGLLALFLLVCLLFTRSRAGITLALVGLLLASVLGARRLRHRGALGVAGTLLLLALAVASVIGLAPVIARFSLDALLADGRHQILTATLEALRLWWPLGSGPGTYALIMPPLQPLALPDVVLNHAHNDYLELLVETGALGALLLAAALGAAGVQGYRLWRRPPPGGAWPWQVGAGLGLLLAAGHALVDYGLRSPLNQLVFALLAGLFLAPPAAAAPPAPPPRPRPRRWYPTLRRGRRPFPTVPHPATVTSDSL